MLLTRATVLPWRRTAWLVVFAFACCCRWVVGDESCTVCLDQYQTFRDDYAVDKDLRVMCKRVELTRACLVNLLETNRRCRSDIQLQVFRMGFKLQLRKYGCERLNGSLPTISTTIITTQQPRDNQAARCKFKGRSRDDDGGFAMRHCGLFGDPHLRTFDGRSQTCAVEGTWSLLDTAHLAVQVTNVKLAENPSATATNKITVLIKQTSDVCSEQKIYQVTSGHLPSAFRDGTLSSGPVGCQATISRHATGARLDICHLNTTIVIRPVGRYLTFTISTPWALARGGVATGLCLSGCPKEELVDYDHLFDSQSNLVEKTGYHNIMSNREAFMLCENANLTDFYFDSCLFDLMMTGDRQFANSARSAMLDAKRLNPRLRLTRDNSMALRKRGAFMSGLYDLPPTTSSHGGASVASVSQWTLLLATITALQLFLRDGYG